MDSCQLTVRGCGERAVPAATLRAALIRHGGAVTPSPEGKAFEIVAERLLHSSLFTIHSSLLSGGCFGKETVYILSVDL